MVRQILRGSMMIAVLITAFVSPATAQAGFELGPFLAYYRPIGTFDPTSAHAVTLPSHPSDKAGPALGVRGRVWGNGKVGVEFQVAEAWSTLGQVVPPGGPIGPTSVRVLAFAAQGLYKVASAERLQTWLSAGGGIVRHGGDSYGRFGSPTSLAGTFGFGSNIRLRGRLNAVLGLTTYVYYLEVRDSSNTLQHGMQVDPTFQAGLTWGWR